MSAGHIDHLMKLWSATLEPYGGKAPFTSHHELYDTIDAISGGSTPWESFIINITSDSDLDSESASAGQPRDSPSWKNADYEVWYRDPQALIRNLFANPSFCDEFDYAPYHEYDHGQHRFGDFMSGDWAWRQAVSVFHQCILSLPQSP
jgi:hypothetical protein